MGYVGRPVYLPARHRPGKSGQRPAMDGDSGRNTSVHLEPDSNAPVSEVSRAVP